MLKKILSSILSTAIVASPALAQAPAAGLTKIGAAAAVKGSITAQAPGAAVGRVLGSGKPLYLNDHVKSDAAGRMQVLLLDETVFTIGPNSDMVLDEFFYNPDTQAGKVAATIVRGTFRFVTGKVARKDPDQMKVKLAVGTIGIRGSVGVGSTGPEGSTIINAGAGGGNDAGESSAGIFVSNNGQTTDLTKPGSGSTISPGGNPSPAQDMSGQLNGIMAGLAAKPGESKGGGDPAAGGSTSESSGKDTASGGALASDTSAENAGVASANNQQVLATQDSVNGVLQGDGFYFSGHSAISCSGAGCTGSGFQGAVQLYVNFNTGKAGGATSFTGPSTFSGSFIHMHNITTPGDTLEQTIGANSGANGFAFTTPGTITLSGANLGSFTATGATGSPSGNFNNTTIALGSTPSTPANVNLTFSGSQSSGGISASGSFTAPYTQH